MIRAENQRKRVDYFLMNTIKLDTTGTNVKMIAHRGLSGLER